MKKPEENGKEKRSREEEELERARIERWTSSPPADVVKHFVEGIKSGKIKIERN
ncbi:hypothetical protein [Thermopetrobacter sp. TC1]|uniref:hypothetical protein n=1 Tax=Thermopetrobacter sp. TC1 TaxID=1495045 RepID=UPI0012E07FCF|nr:hypothetical protein [Thermopetrobacter sp. TC1]